VPEHYRKQLMKVQQRMEKATDVTKGQKNFSTAEKARSTRTSFSTPEKTHKVLRLFQWV
jgi:hypothetical protein